MMTTKNKHSNNLFAAFVTTATLIWASTALAAPDLVSTVEQSGGKTVIKLDFVSDGSVSGLQFDVVLPAQKGKAQVSTGGCLSGLSSAFRSSTCTMMKNGTVRVVVLDMNASILETGPIGEIVISGNYAKSVSNVGIENVVMGDSTGKNIAVDFVQ